MKSVTHKLMLATVAVVLIAGLSRCKKDDNQQQQSDIPNVPVNLTINLNLPQYFNLQNQGGWVYENAGVRGIVIYHHYDDKFYALERNCPFQPNDSCATVSVETNNLFLRCGHYKSQTDTTWIPCCNSQYSLESGFLLSGPSRFPLKNYRISQGGSVLYVTN